MKPQIIIGIGVAALLLASASMYIVRQTEQVLVTEFGKPVRIVKEPGLHFKKPFIEEVTLFDKRLLEFNADPKEILLGDQKRLIVDAYLRFRITDPQKFYESVRDERVMRDRLNTILDSSLRQVMGSQPLQKVLSADRGQILQHITEIVNAQTSGKPLSNKVKKDIVEQAGEAVAEEVVAEVEGTLSDGGFGVEVVDVRIMRADLPKENSEAVYRRMQTEREREAKEFRARGEEEAQKIRSQADNERTIIIAESRREADILRGEGDAEAARIFAVEAKKDPRFFSFFRSMQAYKKALSTKDTTMVMSPDSEFLRHFGKP